MHEKKRYNIVMNIKKITMMVYMNKHRANEDLERKMQENLKENDKLFWKQVNI